MTPAALRSLRKRLGLSKEEFAAAIGFTGKNRAETVWRLETGTRQPSAQTVRLMGQLI